MNIAILDDYADVVRKLDCFNLIAHKPVTIYTDYVSDLDVLADRLQDAEAIVLLRERTPVGEALLQRLPKLKLISQNGHVPHIDLAACTRHGVLVSATLTSRPSYAAAELTWGLMIAALRHIPFEVEALKQGRWQSTIGRGLRGRTLGILGYGRIGKVIAGYAKAFEMPVLVWGREGSRIAAEDDGLTMARDRADFFRRCDVISLHLRLNSDTRGGVTAGDLALMKPTSLLVNTSRAELIAPGALVAALKAGRPGMAAVDVLDHEPVFGRRSAAIASQCSVYPAHRLRRDRQPRDRLRERVSANPGLRGRRADRRSQPRGAAHTPGLIGRMLATRSNSLGDIHMCSWRFCALVAFALSSLIPGLAVAQPYPSKPVKIVVPFTPGGSPDVLARTVAQKLQEIWGQPVIVENQPGAGGAIAAKAVAHAPADGYTWLVAPNSVLVFAPLLGAVPYDPVKDFAPIGLAISVQNLLVVHPALPAKDVKELLALAKARPGQLTYASGGPGSPQNFSLELLKSMSGTSIQHVAYKGAQAALPDLLAGRVDLFLGQANALLPYIESGRLRLLAGTGAKRYASLPRVPTVGEALPGFSVDIWSGFVAPAKTPADVIRKANADVMRVLAMPDVQAVFAKQGIEVRSGTPEAMATVIESDLRSWSRVVNEANIKAE